MKKLLVPTDFTPIANNAVLQAITLAKVAESNIVLLHVVKSRDQIEAAKTTLAKETAKAGEALGRPVEGEVRVGNIFETIGDTAKEIEANLIIMGTHGMKGLQHLTGSKAMKVILNAPVPFIILQDKQPPTSIENILMPIDLNQETKQSLSFAVSIAKLFKSRIHLFSVRQTDPFFIKAQARNVNYAKQLLTEERVSHTILIQEDTGNSFAKDVMTYSRKINSDLIAIVNFTEDQFFTNFGKHYEQNMITNEDKVPVLIVNRKNQGRFVIAQFNVRK